jgi:hypothetical protein
MAERVLQLMKKAAPRDRLGQQARATILKHHSLEEAATQLVAALPACPTSAWVQGLEGSSRRDDTLEGHISGSSRTWWVVYGRHVVLTAYRYWRASMRTIRRQRASLRELARLIRLIKAFGVGYWKFVR